MIDPLKQDRLRLISWPWLIALVLVFILGTVLVMVNGWQAHARAWLNLIVRWFHLIYGVAWIGASFYFIFLENALERTNIREELSGNIWSIHGGGIYYLEKYKTAPKSFPPYLHWFKWDAYFTWVTGFLLLIIVYYSNPQAILLKPGLSLAPWLAVIIALVSLVLAWVVYVALSRTVLLNKPRLFLLVGLVIIAITALLLSQIFSGRGAFIHIGAMLGTIMAGNVFFVIIPSQKALVSAAQKGESLDPTFVSWVQLRSRHNNYITLPVLFTMISNHFPMTYSHSLNWFVLFLLFIAGVAVRHSINVTEKEHHRTLVKGGALPHLLIAAAVIAVAALYITAPKAKTSNAKGDQVSFASVQSVMNKHCLVCHAESPTQAGFSAAPAGIMFDHPETIQAQAAKIQQVAVDSEYMPLGNLTGMTPEERQLLGAWIAQGAHLDH
ncbi:MAG: urate hydroxylase PuuD [Deinococcales bacterium]